MAEPRDDIVFLSPRLADAVRYHALSDPELNTFLDELVERARKALDGPPQPAAVIHYEGLLPTNPDRIESVRRLDDMNRLADLSELYAVVREEPYAAKAREIILAWAKTYEPNGNPINENKFSALFSAYSLLRPSFSTEDRLTIDLWLRRIAEAEIHNDSVPQSNWEAKRLKIVGLIGLALGDQAYLDFALERYRLYVAGALRPDGTSYDLEHRDALSYHLGGLKPLILFSAAVDREAITLDGHNLYDYESPAGASLRKSLEYVIPYATGEKTRKEWVNTQVELDRRRAAAGLEEYQPGMLFNPAKASEALELATYWDPSLVSLVREFHDSPSDQYPTWLAFLSQVHIQPPQ